MYLFLTNDKDSMGIDQVFGIQIANQPYSSRPFCGVTIHLATQGVEIGERGPQVVVQDRPGFGQIHDSLIVGVAVEVSKEGASSGIADPRPPLSKMLLLRAELPITVMSSPYAAVIAFVPKT